MLVLDYDRYHFVSENDSVVLGYEIVVSRFSVVLIFLIDDDSIAKVIRQKLDLYDNYREVHHQVLGLRKNDVVLKVNVFLWWMEMDKQYEVDL